MPPSRDDARAGPGPGNSAPGGHAGHVDAGPVGEGVAQSRGIPLEVRDHAVRDADRCGVGAGRLRVRPGRRGRARAVPGGALLARGARRIGHGTRLGEDPALLAYVVEHKIPLEMCLTSNVHTRTVAALAEHPFKRYLEQGVVVTLSTDGRLMDGISLTDEYYLAHAVLGLSRQDLARVVLAGCESAFLPDYEKVALISRVQSELEAL